MEIKSYTLGKLEKIRKGVSFQDNKRFIAELLQNSLRAKAKNLYITIDKELGFIKFLDDGRGCKNPEDLFTLDLSRWGECTDKGFGIGFWALFAYPCSRVDVSSYIWSYTLNMDDIFINHKLDIIPNNVSGNIKGFEVIIYSEEIKDEYYNLYERIKEEASIQEYNVYLNGDLIDKKDIFNEITNGIFGDFDNRFFKARLKVSEEYYSGVKCFYERRLVTTLYSFGYITGIIELKANAVNLKEPDRTEIIYDDKRTRFYDKIKECSKKLYKSSIDSMDLDTINKMERSINDILDVKDYQKFLKINPNMIAGLQNNKAIIKVIENEHPELTGRIFKKSDIDDNAAAVKAFKDVILSYKSCNSDSEYDNNCYNIEMDDQSLIYMIKNTKKKMWVSVKDVENYKDEIAEAEYYGFTVFKSLNLLYDNVFSYNNVPHVKELNNLMVNTFITNNEGCKNYKEEHAIKLLYPICNFYNLPLSTFQIADLVLKTEIAYDGKIIAKQVVRNVRGKKNLEGLTRDRTIYLDRKCMDLSQFSLFNKKDKVGVNDLKLLMSIFSVVSHELAHLLYKTTDNTKEHYFKQIKIYEEIVKLYIKNKK